MYLARFRDDSRSVELPTTEGSLIGSKITSTCFLDGLRTLLPRSLNSQTRNSTPSLFYKMDSPPILARTFFDISLYITCQSGTGLRTLVFKLSSSIKCNFFLFYRYTLRIYYTLFEMKDLFHIATYTNLIGLFNESK